MKKLIALLLAFCLALSLAACGAPAEPALRFPEQVPEPVSESRYFAEAMDDPDGFILVDGQPVTAPDALIRFLNAAAEKQPAECTVYYFSVRYWLGLYQDHFVSDDGGVTLTEQGLELPEGAALDEGVWREDETLMQLTGFSVLPGGALVIDNANGYEMEAIPLFNDLDLFPDFAGHEELLQKYVQPIWFPAAVSDGFSGPEEFFSGQNFMPAVESMLALEDGKEALSFWDIYPDARMPFRDLFGLTEQYFDISRGHLHELLADRLDEEDCLFYQGGYGGIFPRIIVEGSEEKDGVLTLLLRLFYVDGTYTDASRLELAVRLLEDGSFRYLSLTEVPAGPMEFGAYAAQKTGELLETRCTF